MRRPRRRWTLAPTLTAALLVAAGLGTGCEYDPPPEILLTEPDRGGAIPLDGTVLVEFTEPIDPATLELTLWPRKLDKEEALWPECGTPAAAEAEECVSPVAGPCRGDAATCDGATFRLLQGDRVLEFTPAEALEVGAYILRLSPGLADTDGNDTGVALDVYFFASPTGQGGPTTLTPGVLMTFINLEQPFKFPLELYWHIHDVSYNEATGKNTITGAACDGDPKDPDTVEREDYNHVDWTPEPYESTGFHTIFTGQVYDLELTDSQGRTRPGHYLVIGPFYINNVNTPQVEVVNGSVEVTLIEDADTGRLMVHDGTLHAEIAYIFDPEHGNPYDNVAGGMLGYMLSPAEIAVEEALPGGVDAWDKCASMDDVINFPDP